MIDINGDTHAKNWIHAVKVSKKDNKSVLLIKMHNIQDKLGVKKMSDLTIKAIKVFIMLRLLQKNKQGI